ncbi:MAG: HAD family phosphatase [Prolixibacteraceae bacterium]|jgi:putative hydrolase of the HAD superfamily|nr:HAD family phosphatase [Prolixibacteraceae bacterium]
MLENIIFDLGGALLNIDTSQTRTAFARLGWNEGDWKGINQAGNLIFENLEIGLDTPALFREKIRELLPSYPTDAEIDDAWNAMLLDFPIERVNYLTSLKSKYRLFLLSNTNELHFQRFRNIFEGSFGYSIDLLFEKCYYSHEIGHRKPNPEAFEVVLADAGLDPGKTLFVDDLKLNTETAEKLGLKVLHIEAGTLMERLPEFLEKTDS